MPWPITSYQKFQNRQGMDWGGYGKGFGGGGDLSDPMSTALGMFGMGGGGASSPAPSPWRMKLPAGQSLDSIGITPGQWQGGSFSTPTQMPTFQQGGSPLQMGTQPSSSAGMIRTAATLPSTSTDRSMPGGHTSAQPQQAFFNVQDMAPFDTAASKTPYLGSPRLPASLGGPTMPYSQSGGAFPKSGYGPLGFGASEYGRPGQQAMLPPQEAAYQRRAAQDERNFESLNQYSQAAKQQELARREANAVNTPAIGQYNQIGVTPQETNWMHGAQNAQDTYAQQQRDIGARMQGGMGQTWMGNQATGQPGLQTDRGIPTTGQAQVRSYGTIPMYPEYNQIQKTPDDVARQTDVQTEMRRVANDRIENRARIAAGMQPKPVESYTPLNPDRPNVNSLPAAQYKMPNGETGSILGRANQRQAAADSKRWYMRNVFNYDRAQQRLNSPYGLMVQGQAGEQQRRAQDFQNWVEAQQYSNLRAPFMQDRGPGYNPLGPSTATASVSGPYSPQGIQAQRYQGNHDLGQQAVIANYATENKIPLSQAIQDFGAFGQGPQQGQQGRFPGTPPGAGVSPWQAQPQQQGVPNISPTAKPPENSYLHNLFDTNPNISMQQLQQLGIYPEHIQQYIASNAGDSPGIFGSANPLTTKRLELARRLLGLTAQSQPQQPPTYGDLTTLPPGV